MEKSYKCSFMGRQAGAIGIKSRHEKIVVAADKDAARLKLYDDFDSVDCFFATEIEVEPQTEMVPQIGKDPVLSMEALEEIYTANITKAVPWFKRVLQQNFAEDYGNKWGFVNDVHITCTREGSLKSYSVSTLSGAFKLLHDVMYDYKYFASLMIALGLKPMDKSDHVDETMWQLTKKFVDEIEGDSSFYEIQITDNYGGYFIGCWMDNKEYASRSEYIANSKEPLLTFKVYSKKYIVVEIDDCPKFGSRVNGYDNMSSANKAYLSYLTYMFFDKNIG